MALTVFATIDDINARRATPLTGTAATMATTKASDASAIIQSELSAAGIDWSTRWANGEAYAALLTATTCAMVERAIMSVLPGVKSRQQSAGPYSFTDTMANPTGDLYLTSAERKALGIGRGRFGCIPPARQCAARG